MAAQFNRERAARTLVAAIGMTDAVAAAQLGVGVRTLYAWRARLDTDSELAELFRALKVKADADWAASLYPAIKATIRFIERAANESDPADPAAVHSIAGGLKILSEVAMTQQVIGARLASAHRPADGADREVVAEAPREPRVH